MGLEVDINFVVKNNIKCICIRPRWHGNLHQSDLDIRFVYGPNNSDKSNVLDMQRLWVWVPQWS